MNYLESLVYIESLSPTLQKPCLERMALFMLENGSPHQKYRAIHVAGTNGKGSTVAILDVVLRLAGMRVGRYTGPHLLRWNERFHVDGLPISDKEFSRLATRLRTLSEEFGRRHCQFGQLTWFELLTAMAYFYFAEQQVDMAVVEVGLGGRWDATNILTNPLVSVITNIDLDHTHILGKTVAQIAGEKAGIIKPGIPVVTAAAGDALQEILAKSAASGSELALCRAPNTVDIIDRTGKIKQTLQLPGNRHKLSLAGNHQQVNALVACAALTMAGLDNELWGDSSTPVSDALGCVYWPGRLQFLPEHRLVLDGAHNPAGAFALRSALQELFPGRKFLFVLGCFENKDVENLIKALVGSDDRAFTCEAESKRAVFPADSLLSMVMQAGASGIKCQSVGQALEAAMATCSDQEIIVACGSFATVTDCMRHLGWNRVEDGVSATLMDWSLQSAFSRA